ncbi:MAG: hypothetical protein ACXWQR_01105 [Ktedonobacterales bacterium]
MTTTDQINARPLRDRRSNRQSRTQWLPSTQVWTQLRLALFVACVAILLASCGAQSGSDELAFLRGGALWVARADGSHARELIAGNVAGYAWAPNHHEVIVRYAASDTQAPPAGSTRAAPPARGDLAAVSINGGYPLQITPSDSALQRSDAWWDATSNRVVYSERFANTPGIPVYVVSQIDQPAGIARKTLLDAASLPVLSPDGARVAVIDPDGNLRLGAPSANGAVIASGVALQLPETGRPTHLLWQPQHDALLYPVASDSGEVDLTLRNLHGSAHVLVNHIAHLVDAAFSPDGAQLVVHTTESLAVFDSAGAQQFSWGESDPLALVWWSPDSKRLLVQDANGLTLVDVTSKLVTPLLVYNSPLPAQSIDPSDSWHPATGSPWSPDGARIVFACESRATWRGKALPTTKGGGVGLYVAALTDAGGDTPALIDSHAVSAPSWSSPDPSSAFLVSA